MRKLIVMLLLGLGLSACQSEEPQSAADNDAAATSAATDDQAPAPAVGEAPAESEMSDSMNDEAHESDSPSMAERIHAAMAGSHRSDANTARDQYRHPADTLTFFGLEPDMTVVEIWPGGGWYTEILAPALRDTGKLVVAVYDKTVPDQPDYRYRLTEEMEERFAQQPDLFDQVAMVPYSLPGEQSMGPADSADMVVTFRNAHGWVGNGVADAVIADAYRVLKPGGILGFVQHRADPGSDPAETAQRGYVSEEAIIAMAEGAGFELAERSEINANPADTKDHPEGVWTLPPSLRLGDQDREKYEAIGESDRMTLRFVKPGDSESISKDSYEGG